MHRGFSPERAARVKTYLRERLGVPREGSGGAPIALKDLKLAPSRLSKEDVAKIRALLPMGAVSDEGEERLLHSYGQAYADLLALRRGTITRLTDLVVHPSCLAEVEAVVKYASEHDLAIVPWGGGTSVVGGVDPEMGRHKGVLTLSLARLVDPLWLNPVNRTARFQCGIRGPDLESFLDSRGHTLGHFPQSFEFSTLGGWLATRSSGQASGRYGDIADRVRGATVVTPEGTIVWERGSSESAGPDLSSVLLGNEGTLGIFVEATLTVEPHPEARSFRALMFPDWNAGIEAMRSLAQSTPAPAVLRLSDADETALTLEGRAPAESISGRVRERFGPRILELRKIDPEAMCLAILSYEGSAADVATGERLTRDVVRSAGALDLGRSAGESWRKDRFMLPYLRDDLMEDGWFVETLETGASWCDLGAVAVGVRQALVTAARSQRFALLTGMHISHATSQGACLYVTLIAPQVPGKEATQWKALKDAATEAVLKAGGALSHHHGVGTLHRPWIREVRRSVPTRSFRAVKNVLDPHGTLNPGKTLADEEPPHAGRPAG